MTETAISPLRRHDRRHDGAQLRREDAEGLCPSRQDLAGYLVTKFRSAIRTYVAAQQPCVIAQLK
jgi:hypothetical protein